MGSASSARPVVAWFRNDLRLHDNAALSAAAASGQPVVPVVILDEETTNVRPLGGASRWWLKQSLTRLASDLREAGATLLLRQGRAADVLARLVDETEATAIHFSRSYTPGGRAQEAALQAAGLTGMAKRYRGFLLHEPETLQTGQGQPYKVYTPFSKACFTKLAPRQARPKPGGLDGFKADLTSDALEDWALYDGKPDWASLFSDRFTPGEAGARAALNSFVNYSLEGYGSDRDLPAGRTTSRLSPHLHFGEISPFTCWHVVQSAMDKEPKLEADGTKFLKEMLWREFSSHLLFHWPDLANDPLRPEFSAIAWRKSEDAFERWKRGQTGYPMVDAGMRELWATGWMHNRVRMLTASFLIKHLLIDWRDGEKWFWDTLVDADDANNPASWQWVAGSGADASPWFRIFNPVLQGEKFDSDGAYVRRWCPELAGLPDDVIHQPWTATPAQLKTAGVRLGESYPRPMVDHKQARARALDALKQTKGAPAQF